MSRSGRQEQLARSRAYAGGMAAAKTNQGFHLRTVVAHELNQYGTIDEVLECGHRQRPRSDMIGQYDAVRRRCRQCPKEPS